MNSQLSLSTLAAEIRDMANHVRAAEDVDIADKISDLADKAENGATIIRVAFCGLFSAGKTSLLNVLCERNDLATGAVPTTALVKEVPLPGTNVILLDTPGVDSTDEAHQAATEAALHLADAVALVMDYQQVESDTNLELAESFTARGKTLYLIVNQVDKHLEWELPFAEYQQRIERTFLDWGIEYQQVFYTSTRNPNDDGLHALGQTLSSLSNQLDVTGSLVTVLQSLLEEHANRQFETQRQQVDDACALEFGKMPFDEAEAEAWLSTRELTIRELSDANAALQQATSEQTQALIQTLTRTIDLAQISPYETTELGRHYIESLRPGFKVGWLRAAAQTEAERARRLEVFARDLAERTEKFLTWPFQGVLREALTNSSWAEPAWVSEVDTVTVTVSEELCSRLVKPGSLISEQYPYQYVKDVVQSIKNTLRGRFIAQMDEWGRRATAALDRSLTSGTDWQRLHRETAVLRAWLCVRSEMRSFVDKVMDGIDIEAKDTVYVGGNGRAR